MNTQIVQLSDKLNQKNKENLTIRRELCELKVSTNLHVNKLNDTINELRNNIVLNLY